MARPLRIKFAGAFFHAINRGNGRQDIFFDDQDRRNFLWTLADSKEMYGVKVIAYCLMTNHVHLFLNTPTWESDLPSFMKRLEGTYAARFNRKYGRVGHLFQGRYSAFLVDSDSYLLEVPRYIHLNPCAAKIVKDPVDYPWSSMKEYLASEPFLCDPTPVLEHFPDKAAFRAFVHERIGDPRDILKEVKAGLFLGSDAFVSEMKARFGIKAGIDISRRQELIRTAIDRILPSVRKEPKRVQIYALCEWARQPQKEVAAVFGVTEGAISRTLSRFRQKLLETPALRARLEQLRPV